MPGMIHRSGAASSGTTPSGPAAAAPYEDGFTFPDVLLLSEPKLLRQSSSRTLLPPPANFRRTRSEAQDSSPLTSWAAGSLLPNCVQDDEPPAASRIDSDVARFGYDGENADCPEEAQCADDNSARGLCVYADDSDHMPAMDSVEDLLPESFDADGEDSEQLIEESLKIAAGQISDMVKFVQAVLRKSAPDGEDDDGCDDVVFEVPADVQATTPFLVRLSLLALGQLWDAVSTVEKRMASKDEEIKTLQKSLAEADARDMRFEELTETLRSRQKKLEKIEQDRKEQQMQLEMAEQQCKDQQNELESAQRRRREQRKELEMAERSHREQQKELERAESYCREREKEFETAEQESASLRSEVEELHAKCNELETLLAQHKESRSEVDSVAKPEKFARLEEKGVQTRQVDSVAKPEKFARLVEKGVQTRQVDSVAMPEKFARLVESGVQTSAEEIEGAALERELLRDELSCAQAEIAKMHSMMKSRSGGS